MCVSEAGLFAYGNGTLHIEPVTRESAVLPSSRCQRYFRQIVLMCIGFLYYEETMKLYDLPLYQRIIF